MCEYTNVLVVSVSLKRNQSIILNCSTRITVCVTNALRKNEVKGFK